MAAPGGMLLCYAFMSKRAFIQAKTMFSATVVCELCPEPGSMLIPEEIGVIPAIGVFDLADRYYLLNVLKPIVIKDLP